MVKYIGNTLNWSKLSKADKIMVIKLLAEKK